MRSSHSTRTKQPHTANRGIERRGLLARRMRLAGHALNGSEEGRAPRAYGENAPEKDNSVNAEAACAGPVGVGLKVEPEGELVERERRTHTITDRHEPAEKNGKRRMGAAKVKQPAIADEQQDENSPHKMMDVKAANHYPLERAAIVNDKVDQQTHAQEGDEEGDRGQEHAAARAVRNGGADEIAEARQLQKNQQDDDDHAGEDKQKDCAASWHTPLKHPGRANPKQNELRGEGPQGKNGSKDGIFLYSSGVHWIRRAVRGFTEGRRTYFYDAIFSGADFKRSGQS
jgi:hypothetical protein